MLKFAPPSTSQQQPSETASGLVLAASESSSTLNKWTFTSSSSQGIRVTPLVLLPEASPVKALAWTYFNSNSNFDSPCFAFGASTGRVAFAKYEHDAPQKESTSTSSHSLGNGSVTVINEYNDKPARPCSLLAFSPSSSLLLIGLGKYRDLPTCYVWDPVAAATLASLAPNEALLSAAWLSGSSNSFLAGVTSRWVRIYDLRRTSTATAATEANNAAQVVIATRFVNGLATDPFDSRRFASYAEGPNGGVAIWDIRKTAVPVLSLEAGLSTGMRGGVGGLEWCPTRPGCLAACGKDASGTVLVWDLREGYDGDGVVPATPTTTPAVMGYTIGQESSYSIPTPPPAVSSFQSASAFPTTDPSQTTRTIPILVQERRLKAASTSSLSAVSMAWVPFTTSPSTKQKVAADVLVTMNLEDGSLKSNSLMNVPVASWGANAGSGAGHGIVAAFGRELKWRDVGGGGDWDDDIASVIKRRAVDGYALDTKTNISLLQRKIYAESSQDLIETWSLLRDVKSQSRNYLMDGKDYSLLGIAQIVHDATVSKQRESSSTPTISNYPSKSIPTIISYFDSYSSEFRTMGLRMCGRLFETDASLELKLQSFEQRGNFEQAAGFALFYSSSLERALRALNASKDDKLRLVAAALAGYMAGTPSAQWASLCHTLSAELKDPYLRSLFALMASNGDWNQVLELPNGLQLHDKIGIALRFLPDAELRDYLRVCAQQLTDEGNIRGLLILGFITPEGVNLLERYVDVFGDFQSAALISLAARSGGAGVVEGKVSNWFENYRNILDQWQLFHERALLDISKSKLYRLASTPATSTTRSSPQQQSFQNVTPTIQAQIHIRCNFCNGNISQSALAQAASSVTPKKSVTTAAAGTAPATSCPHCKKALPRCALCLMHMGVPVEGTTGSELQGFEGWFTWCQTCRHGGHAKHVQEWFRAHDGCPVAGCDCSCL